jgi:hypothetical protein
MSQKQKKTAKLTKKQFNLIVGINKNLQDQKTKIETYYTFELAEDPRAKAPSMFEGDETSLLKIYDTIKNLEVFTKQLIENTAGEPEAKQMSMDDIQEEDETPGSSKQLSIDTFTEKPDEDQEVETEMPAGTETEIETDGIEVQEDDPEAESDDWEDEWNSADWLN